MQASKGKKSPLVVSKAIYNESGVTGFWKGLGASLVLCINPAIQWMVYEQLALLLQKITKKKVLSPLDIFVLGAIGKIAATLVTYPYIIVKSRMQAETSSSVSLFLSYSYYFISFLQILCYKKEGF